jgi:type VI secretion system protein ImpF
MVQDAKEATRLVGSLLDRLADETAEAERKNPGWGESDLWRLKNSVAEDLQNLLNTRQEEIERLPDEFNELTHSLLFYGLPDFTTYNLLNPADLDRLRRSIESAIKFFEPRLQRVQVKMETPDANDRTVHFRIDGLLRIEPAPEPIIFDTVLHLGTREYEVKRRG